MEENCELIQKNREYKNKQYASNIRTKGEDVKNKLVFKSGKNKVC